MLPPKNDEHLVNQYQKSNFSLKHSRYHFQEEYNKRKLFKINCSYYPYLIIEKSLSYEENAMKIYNSKGMLNISKFELYYKGRSNNNSFKMNQIHLSMAFDNNYSDLSLISIASILNTSCSYTFIHFHILGLNFGFDEIKKIIDLRHINNRVEFVFYNAKQVEYDFDHFKKGHRGFGNIARILCPQIINKLIKFYF